MRLHHHTLVSLSVSGLLYMAFNSIGLAVSSFITGVFIDIDHIVDVIREHGPSVKIKEFFSICNNAQFDRIILICHGWEWLLIMGVTAWAADWNPWITGAFIGFGQHLILDTFSNSSNFYSYSIFWRWKKDFNFDRIFYKMTPVKYKYKKDLREAQ